MEAAGALEYVLETDAHRNNMKLLSRMNEKDRHILYLAFTSQSKLFQV